MLACAAGHPAAVDLLLSEPRVNASAPDNAGNTAFMLACRQNRSEVVQILLAHGDRVDLQDPAPYSSLLPTGFSLSDPEFEPIHPIMSSRLVELLPRFSRSPPLFDQPAELETAQEPLSVRNRMELRMSQIRTLEDQMNAFNDFAGSRKLLSAELEAIRTDAVAGLQIKLDELITARQLSNKLMDQLDRTAMLLQETKTVLDSVEGSLGPPKSRHPRFPRSTYPRSTFRIWQITSVFENLKSDCFGLLLLAVIKFKFKFKFKQRKERGIIKEHYLYIK